MTLKRLLRSFFLLPVLFSLGSCGSDAQPSGNLPTAVTQTPLVRKVPAEQPVVASQQPQQTSFSAWVAAFRQEALAKGIAPQVFDSAFAQVTAPAPQVVKSDQTQPEKVRLFGDYIHNFITEKKLDAARDQWTSHADLLKQVSDSYDVPAPIMLALWQTESRFGENQGSYNVIQALTTLAYDGRRAEFFRKELFDALTILQQEHFDPSVLVGSWAGAMGQVQFMPSSYLAFAVDFDGDGKRDIWTDDADAAASMANYLHTRGWNDEFGWGAKVHLSRQDDMQQWVDSKEKHTLGQWRKLGVRPVARATLPAGTLLRLVVVDKDPDYAYLVTSNYDVIMDWNRSVYFATAVNLLADAIAKQQ